MRMRKEGTKQIRLWHDDCRPAPEGWVWARRNEDAQDILLTGNVVEISLDHDLGYHNIDFETLNPDEVIDAMQLRGQAEETGLDLVRWMVEHDLVPERVTIHSWNPAGARNMQAHLEQNGHACAVVPFVMR